MERFNTMQEAAELAVTRCTHWSFVTSKDRYNLNGLLALAEMSDSEDPIDEDSFYVVSPTGAIGLCEDGEDIDWLFLTGSSEDEDLPATNQVDPQINFCPKCGASVNAGARFCGKCSGKLR